MDTTLAPILKEVKYWNLSKEVVASILTWDAFGKEYRPEQIQKFLVYHDIFQVYLKEGGMIPIAISQLDQFLEQVEYVPVERKVVSSPGNPIEVVWEDDKGGFTRNTISGETHRFRYADSRISGMPCIPGEHYWAVADALHHRPGSYQMEF